MNIPFNPNEPQELPLTDPRYPGLHFEYARPGAKKSDPDYRDRIVSEDRQFDIFKTPDTTFLKDAQINLLPVTPFEEYTKGVAFLDCEWIGADGGAAKGNKSDVLVAIGIKNRGKHYIACNRDKTEADLIRWCFAQLAKLEHVHTIAGYASYGFFRDGYEDVPVDFSMLYHRALHHKINGCPWKPVKGNFATYRWQNAIVFGRPLEAPAWESQRYELVDIYPQIVSYDSLVRKLENYRLKDAVIGFGLRDDRRLEIGDKVYEFYARGEVDTIKEYLCYDLDDTELLWNFLIVQSYFTKEYLDWSLQRITTTGTGSWWNQYLIKATGDRPQKTQTCHYKGALTFYHAGVFRNCVKIDFSGLYPSIMLTYLVCSWKDKGYVSLKTLQFLLKYRKQIKNSDAYKRFDSGIIDSEGIDADGKQNTCKTRSNSLYGLWNTQGLNFNDPYAGAAVTAYGRNLARYMITWLADHGVEVVGLDTDGAIGRFTHDNYTEEERDQKFRELVKQLNETLPGITYVDYESVIPLVYIPPNIKTTKKAAQTLAEKLNSIDCYEDVSPDNLNPGLSKNYIYFVKTKNGYKMVKKGKFKKRGFSYLDSGFVIDYITRLFYDGDEAAIAFALEVRDQITSGTFPLNKLQKTVLVAANWVEFPKHGFPIGSKPTVHYVWRGETTGKRVIKKVFVPSADSNEPYAPDYYLERFNEIVKCLPNSNEILNSKTRQLTLV